MLPAPRAYSRLQIRPHRTRHLMRCSDRCNIRRCPPVHIISLHRAASIRARSLTRPAFEILLSSLRNMDDIHCCFCWWFYSSHCFAIVSSPWRIGLSVFQLDLSCFPAWLEALYSRLAGFAFWNGSFLKPLLIIIVFHLLRTAALKKS